MLQVDVCVGGVCACMCAFVCVCMCACVLWDRADSHVSVVAPFIFESISLLQSMR